MYGTIDYVSFLVPRLVMMSVLQNAFANTSSSMIQIQNHWRNWCLLGSPLTPLQMFIGYGVRGVAGFGRDVGHGVVC